MPLLVRHATANFPRLGCLPDEEMAGRVLAIEGLDQPAYLVTLPDISTLELRKEDLARPDVADHLLDCWHYSSPGSVRSVVLLDVGVRPVEQVLVLVELVLEERLAERLLHLAFAGVGRLPAVEADDLDDLVDVGDDTLDDDRGVVGLRLLEQLREGLLAPLFVLDRRHGTLGLDYVTGEVEQRLQELNAEQQALLVPGAKVLESLAERLEARIVEMVPKSLARP